MKHIFAGKESSGKSLAIAQKTEFLIKRNAGWLKITGRPRPIVSNMRYSVWVEEWAKSVGIPIIYWKDFDELLKFSHCDIIIDEVGIFFDAKNWDKISLEARIWLAQGEKSGIEIYGTAQNFEQVAPDFRRLVKRLDYVTKFIGSNRPDPTKPPVKKIWGLCIVRAKDPTSITDANKEGDAFGFPSFFFITEQYTSMYDTTQKVPRGELPRLKHMVQLCEHFDSEDPKHICDFKKISHS